ncbi:MAG: hypothetical protein Q8Q67_01175 [bacterium]|nr:hypothetical protein [bacterium]
MKPLFIISIIALLAIGFFVFNNKEPVITHVSSILVEQDSDSLIADSSLIAVGQVESIKYLEEESTTRNKGQDIFTIAELQIEKHLLPKTLRTRKYTSKPWAELLVTRR